MSGAKIVRGLQEAAAIEAVNTVRDALTFYAEAWEDEFGFLGTEPRDRVPTDALAEDRGNRAKMALARLASIEGFGTIEPNEEKS